jgi:mono/diheme cytochrome c family protein
LSSQLKYIFEASLILCVAFITTQAISFLSSARFYIGPNSTVVDNNISKKSGSAPSKGKSLFVQHCARCHSIKQPIVGPALEGIEDRVADRKLLIAWIRNSPEVLKRGDQYFTDLFNQYNKTPMDPFTQLSEEEIESILEYITGK